MMADPSATPIEATTRPDAGRLFAALELGKSRWLVTVDAPGSDKLSRHAVAGGDGAALLDLLARLRTTAERRTGRPVEVLVIQEAGLDGFWLHRLLERNGISSHVVDPASIAVNRRHRRAKTDTIDGEMLLRSLMAWARGERRVCSMVRPPSPEEEDRRRLTRERATLLKERIQHTNRIKVVFTQMTKADVLALGAGGQHVADLDVGVGDDHPVDQQQHELAALLEAGPGQAALHPGTESLERGRHAGELLAAGRVVAQLLLLLGQRLHVPLQIAPPPSVLVERDDRSEVGVREPLQLVPQVRLAAA
jgi:transposase